MKVLIQKQPQLVKEKLDREQTILHLCVAYNSFEALEFLIDSGAADDELLNSKDSNGNTILHLAAILKQVKTTKYLLSIHSIKENANSMNGKSLTALDIMDLFPRDYKTMEIKETLMEASFRRANDIQTPVAPPSSSLSVSIAEEPMVNVSDPPATIFSQIIAKLLWIWKEYVNDDHENWLEESRGYLVLASTLTTTMAFQAGINPPGGSWQDTVSQGPAASTFHYAGTSILASTDALHFKNFFAFNTLALLSSLSTLLLLITRFPLKNKIFMSLLLINMCVTVTFIALAYLFSATMLIPDALDFDDSYLNTLNIYHYSWIGVCVFVALLPLVRIIGWFYRKLRVFISKPY